MKREYLIDNVRLFAIILVILGHAIQYNIVDSFDNIVFRMIYSFHMPLFFFISGYVSYYSITSNNPFILKRIRFILYPFILWSSFYLIYSNGFSAGIDKLFTLFEEPSQGYWFLWVLFWIYVLSALVCKVKKKYLIALIIVLLYLLPIKEYGVSLIKYHAIYFIFGLLVFKYKEILKKFELTKVFKFLFVFFAILLSTLYLKDNTDYYDIIGYSLITKMAVYSFKILIATFMIAATFIIIDWLFKLNIYKKELLTRIGAYYTLHIYLIHVFFYDIINSGNRIIDLLSNFLFSFLLSLVIIFILNLKYLSKVNYILFGK